MICSLIIVMAMQLTTHRRDKPFQNYKFINKILLRTILLVHYMFQVQEKMRMPFKNIGCFENFTDLNCEKIVDNLYHTGIERQ